MANKLVRSNATDEELKHFGVLGMKWGIRRANNRTRRLTKKVEKTVKRFNKGKAPETAAISTKVRKQKYRVDKNIRKAEKFLKKHEKANAKQIVNRFNRDPEKKVAVEEYLKVMKLNSVPLAELRMQLLDIRV